MATIKFEPMGIGDLIRRGRLVVPPNQRSYAWEKRNVLDLLKDLNAAMNAETGNGGQDYFLGTIVLVDAQDGKPPQISDGQQRIATTAIILARIRDLYKSLQQSARATSIQHDYIFKIDLDSAEEKSQVTLNTEDNSFFVSTILGSYPHKADNENTFIRAPRRIALSEA